MSGRLDRILLALGALSACIAVGLGAFAAHGLRGRLPLELLVTFEVGVRYQMYHALALVAAGLAYSRWPAKSIVVAGGLFVAGTVLFSGSLYLLAASGIRSFGMVAPVGGLALLAGWVCFAWGAWRS